MEFGAFMENSYNQNQPNDYAKLSIDLMKQEAKDRLLPPGISLYKQIYILMKELNITEIPPLPTDEDKEKRITKLLELLIQKGLRAKFLGQE